MSQYILISNLWTILARSTSESTLPFITERRWFKPNVSFSKVLLIKCQNGPKFTPDHVIKSLEFDIFLD